uniref:Reverse transcriptase domain-containing protein n=1 Tax=Tanacetum cinerariifolium TaxID=118510 RepID=A0A699GTL5_TANCI|nr:hypothetical protein [Tanacetum cinerariifolium]
MEKKHNSWENGLLRWQLAIRVSSQNDLTAQIQDEEKNLEGIAVINREQEEQAALSFTPYCNFSMIDDEEVLQSREKFMKAIQTFLQKFSRYPFGVMPKVLLIAWEIFYEIKHAFTDKQYQPDEIQELTCKLLEDVRNISEELAEYINSPSWNHLTFYDNDEEHSIQYKEYLENSSNAIAPVLPTEKPEYSLSMGYEHPSTIPEMELDEVIKSSVKNLVQIPSEYKVTSDNESGCDLPICEDHSEILSDSNNDDTSSDDDVFEDIEYIEASLVSLEEENDVYQEEKEIDLEYILQIQDVILCEKLLSINLLIADIEFLNDNPTPDRIEPDQGRLTSVVKNNISDKSTNGPLLEEVDLFLASDNSIPPGIGNFNYDSEGDIYFLEELLSNDSISLPENESFNFDHHDDPSFPRPPPEPPDVEFFFDFEPDSGELISAMMNNIDELIEDERFDSEGGEIYVFANIEDDDYFPFIFVIRIFLPYLTYLEVSPLLLSIGSEDTIFDPGIST